MSQLSFRLSSVYLSSCLSVCHTLQLEQSDYEIFAVDCIKETILCDKILCCWARSVFSNEGVKELHPPPT